MATRSTEKTIALDAVTDDNQWNAECLFGKLCIVAHAAFLDAGFRPRGTPVKKTPRSWTRRYSLPQLGEHDEPEEGAYILRLRRHRDGHTALKAYHHYHQDGIERREKLDNAAVVGFLSGTLGRAAHDLATPGSTGRWFWKLLAHELCRDLITCARRAKGLPAAPSFDSLPDDVKASILARVDCPKSVVMVECASKELRDLVAEHDAEIWEPHARRWNKKAWKKHKKDKNLGDFISWKQWYVEASLESSAVRTRYRRVVQRSVGAYNPYPRKKLVRIREEEEEEEGVGPIAEDLEVKQWYIGGGYEEPAVCRRWSLSLVTSTGYKTTRHGDGSRPFYDYYRDGWKLLK
ncbi:hypothetical protein QOZ80_3BG0275730 [Eleusine coracana subsp. coracana]|nr:hypothetical protein QOZ80_3BG0275730 [Eleusine coracana subsp. coracana]